MLLAQPDVSKRTLTDANGFYRFDGLRPGTQSLDPNAPYTTELGTEQPRFH